MKALMVVVLLGILAFTGCATYEAMPNNPELPTWGWVIHTRKFKSLDITTQCEVIDRWYADAYGNSLLPEDESLIKHGMANVAGITYSTAYKQQRLTDYNTTNTQYGLADIANVIEHQVNNYQNSVYKNSPSNFQTINNYGRDGYQGFSAISPDGTVIDHYGRDGYQGFSIINPTFGTIYNYGR